MVMIGSSFYGIPEMSKWETKCLIIEPLAWQSDEMYFKTVCDILEEL